MGGRTPVVVGVVGALDAAWGGEGAAHMDTVQGARFESRPRHWLPWQRQIHGSSLHILSRSFIYTVYSLDTESASISPNRFLPDPFHFIIHQSYTTARRYMVLQPFVGPWPLFSVS